MINDVIYVQAFKHFFNFVNFDALAGTATGVRRPQANPAPSAPQSCQYQAPAACALACFLTLWIITISVKYHVLPVARFSKLHIAEQSIGGIGNSGQFNTCARCCAREGETVDPARQGALLEFIAGKCVYCRWVHGVTRNYKSWHVPPVCLLSEFAFVVAHHCHVSCRRKCLCRASYTYSMVELD